MVSEIIHDGVVRSLANDDDIMSIGLSSNPLPNEKGEGDIDIFAYCSKIPPATDRIALYPKDLRSYSSLKVGVFDSPIWGIADYVEIIHGIETWLMYFTVENALEDFERMIKGENIDRINGYYPSGRLAMFRNMTILFERTNFLGELKSRLSTYPLNLRKELWPNAWTI